jgi:hypothetical protein
MLIDINSRLGFDGRPEVLRDHNVARNLMYNLFATYLNTEKFEPGHGSALEGLLHSDVSLEGSILVYQSVLDDLAREVPVIKIDSVNSQCTPDFSLPGYLLEIYFSLNGVVDMFTFRLPRQGA